MPKLTPHAHQEAAIDKILAEPTKSALLASDMGQGKTLVSVEFALRAGFTRLLIVGVKDTFEQWAERVAAQSDGAVTLLRLDGTVAGQRNFRSMIAGDIGWFFSGSQYLATQDWAHRDKIDPVTGEPQIELDKMDQPTGKIVRERIHLKTYKKMKNPLDALIFDEIHVVSNRKSVGIRTVRTIPTAWKLAVSGTWYANKFEGAWSITQWLWPDLIDSSSVRWKAEWCEQKTVEIPHGKTVVAVVGEKDPGEFVKSLPCYIRAEADEQPPPARLVHVELSARQQMQYDDLVRDAVVYLETHPDRAATHGPVEALVAEIPIVLRSRLRTSALGELYIDAAGELNFADNTQSSKLFALRQIVDAWQDDAPQRVAIYCHSKRFVKVVVARMRAASYNAVEWSGDVSSTNRAEIKRAFIAGEVQYIVAVIAAFNAGLDGFQRVCNKVVWLSEQEGDSGMMAQALARFFRPGRTEANGGFEHVKILAKDTHDEGIYSAALHQYALNRRTLNIDEAA